MFDGELRVESPAAEAQLGRIPPGRGVALLLADADRPIVLLPAAEMRSRVRNRLRDPRQKPHRNLPDLLGITRKVLWKRTWGHFETDLWYFELARAIWPRTYTKLLAWKPAWFVHVDVAAEFPHFRRTREVFAAPGRYWGPFAAGRSADRFIETLQDAFGLCREYRYLVRSPRARACSYGQIGRCVRPCDGGITMAEYRQIVRRAADFADGERASFNDELRQRMKDAAGQFRFEAAAGLKARLDRLAELDGPACRYVRPAAEFRFLLVQPGSSRKRVRVFLVDRGLVPVAEELEYPLRMECVDGIIRRMLFFVRADRPVGEADRWRMGLVSHCIYGGEVRRGLVVRWDERLDGKALAEKIEGAGKLLRLGGKAAPDAETGGQ